MKNRFLRYFLLSLSFVLAYGDATAQNDTLTAAAGDRYLISAKAGGVNFIEGTVTVARENGKSGLLLRGDQLEIGDRVSTGADGKVEILLNPGSYIRLGGNSTFSFKTTTLDDLQLSVMSGSAILEVFAADEFKVFVNTPKSSFVIVTTGVYRIDVLNDREARLEVWRGSARAGGGETVSGGRVAVLGGSGNVSISKFDRDEQDALDIWSKERSKELAKLTKRLKTNDMRTALMRSFLGSGWDMYNSFGLWVYNPFYNSHCFLPFGYGWSSPYGYGYSHNIYWYKLPRVTHMPTGGTIDGPTHSSTPTILTGSRTIPPFIVMQQTMDTGMRGTDRGTYDSSSSSPSYSPSYSPPASSPSSSSSPAATGARSDPTGTKP